MTILWMDIYLFEMLYCLLSWPVLFILAGLSRFYVCRLERYVTGKWSMRMRVGRGDYVGETQL